MMKNSCVDILTETSFQRILTMIAGYTWQNILGKTPIHENITV